MISCPTQYIKIRSTDNRSKLYGCNVTSLICKIFMSIEFIYVDEKNKLKITNKFNVVALELRP